MCRCWGWTLGPLPKQPVLSTLGLVSNSSTLFSEVTALAAALCLTSLGFRHPPSSPRCYLEWNLFPLTPLHWLLILSPVGELSPDKRAFWFLCFVFSNNSLSLFPRVKKKQFRLASDQRLSRRQKKKITTHLINWSIGL